MPSTKRTKLSDELAKVAAKLSPHVEERLQKVKQIHDLLMPIIHHLKGAKTGDLLSHIEKNMGHVGLDVTLSILQIPKDKNKKEYRSLIAQEKGYPLSEEYKKDVYESVRIEVDCEGSVEISHGGWGLTAPEKHGYRFNADGYTPEQAVTKILLHLSKMSADHINNHTYGLIKQIEAAKALTLSKP